MTRNIILRGAEKHQVEKDDVSQKSVDSNVREWILIELQGELVHMCSMSELSLPPMQVDFTTDSANICKHFLHEVCPKHFIRLKFNLVGDLHFDKNTGDPRLIVGHHLLFGKREKLSKPFVAMKRVESEGAELGEQQPLEEGHVEYEVYAVATEKLIFNLRPKPIVS